VIADDQAIIRAGLAAVLEAEQDIEVAGQAASADEAIMLAERERPDVVLIASRIGGSGTAAATERIATGATARSGRPVQVLTLTTGGLDDHVTAALRSGSAGFLLKDAHPKTVADVVRAIGSGDRVPDRAATRALITEFVAGGGRSSGMLSEQLKRLTERELEVLRLASRGLTNAEIAAELVVSTSTVKTHMNALLGKLKLRDRVQSTIFAYETGLIRPGHG
jgi:DNA-binding NarL/FixJ family response regulator